MGEITSVYVPVFPVPFIWKRVGRADVPLPPLILNVAPGVTLGASLQNPISLCCLTSLASVVSRYILSCCITPLPRRGERASSLLFRQRSGGGKHSSLTGPIAQQLFLVGADDLSPDRVGPA